MGATVPTGGAGRCVLLVNDDALQLRLEQATLERLGFAVVPARDGAAALAEAARCCPDAVVSDVLMPEMDGFRLCAALRQDPRLSEVPILLVTSMYTEPEDEALGRAVGATAFIHRDPALRGVGARLLEVLRTGPKAAAPIVTDPSKTDDYLRRVSRQLERQSELNAQLSRQLTVNQNELTALADVGRHLSTENPLSTVLRDHLQSCLDTAGIAGAAVFLVTDDGTLERVVGFGECTRSNGAGAILEDQERTRCALHRPETVALDGGGSGRALRLHPIAWRGRRMGVLAISWPAAAAAAAPGPFGEALAERIAQNIVLFEAFARIRRDEEHYRRVFESAILGMYRSTRDGELLEANAAALRMFGYASLEEFRQGCTSAFGLYLDPARRAEFVKQLEAEGGVDGFEFEAVRGDGSRVWLSHSARAVRDEAGRLTHIEGILRDIDDRKKGEVALEAMRQRLDYVLSMSPAAIFILHVDPAGGAVPQWVSDNMVRLTGYSAAEACAPGWWHENIHPADRGLALDELGAHTRADQVATEYRFRHKGGGYRWIRDEVRVSRRHDGGGIELIGCWTDVTARRDAEQALRESEQRHRTMVEGAAVGIVRVDRDLRILDANPALERMLGYGAVELQGRPITDLTHADDIVSSRAQWQAVVRREREHYQIVKRYVRRDGRSVWCSLTVSAVRDDAGEVEFGIGMLEDITDRRQAEERLAQSEARYRRMMDTAPEAILVFDPPTHGIVDFNTKSLQLFDRTAEEMRAVSIDQLFCPARCPVAVSPAPRHLLSHFEDACAGREAVFECCLPGPEGGECRPCEMRLQRLSTADGALVRASVIDITARKRAEDETRRQREVLAHAQKMADMGTLLAGVAHELNNPLAVVLGQAELIQRQAEGPAVVKRAEALQHAAERCARIVGNFLSLARQRAPERRRVSVNAVVLEALELLSYQLRVDNVDVETLLGRDLTPIWADPHQVHQVIVNLITNAHQAVRRQEPPRRLRIATDGEGDGVRIRVADTGPGIPDSIRGRIFDPFFTTKPAGEGTGLGLSLCRGIVDSHGGALELEPYEAGAGAAFVVKLPIGSRQEDRLAVSRPDMARSGRGRHVLIVDDEPSISDVLQDMLQDMQYVVDLAVGGEEALDKLRRNAYDLIMSDVRMPGLDGPSLLREAEALLGDKTPPFVFMTGDALARDTSAFLSQPGRWFIEKPFYAETVARLLGDVFENGRPHPS